MIPAHHYYLKAIKKSSNGLILEHEDGSFATFPTRLVPDDYEIGKSYEVFVYTGSDNIALATNQIPTLKAGEFGFLKVKEVNAQGAFLDWGIPKDLFVPFREQKQKLVAGKYVLVHLFIDTENGRPLASAKIERFLDKSSGDLKEKQEVDILIYEETDLGVNVIINNKYKGIVYHNEIFRDIKIGEKCKAYIKRIREDQKIDVALEKSGFGRVDPATKKILDTISKNGGFLNLHDNSDPEEIKTQLQMSKKTFKKSIGALYKQKLIVIKEDGLYLVK